MTSRKMFRRNIAAAVCCAMLVAPVPSFGQDSARPANEASAPGKVNTIDVVLRDGGQVVGRVIDDQGNPVEGYGVGILHGDTPIAKAVTDSTGTFTVRGLRSGLHRVSTVNGDKPLRFWTSETAPPSAHDRMLMQVSGKVVRGQFDPGVGPVGPVSFLDPVTLGVLGISIAALVIAIDTNQNINTLENRIRRIPRSP